MVDHNEAPLAEDTNPEATEGCDDIQPLSDDDLEDVSGGWDGSPPPEGGG